MPLEYVAVILIVIFVLAGMLNSWLPRNEPDRQALPTAASTTVPSFCSDLRFSPAGWIQEGGLIKRNPACYSGSDGGYIGACPCADNYVAVVAYGGTAIFYTTTPQSGTAIPISPTWTATTTKTLTPTDTRTVTLTASRTPTQTATKTSTATPSRTATATPSKTPTSTFTVTPSPTLTPTFTSTPSPTVTASVTPTSAVLIAFDVTISYRGKDTKGVIKILNVRDQPSIYGLTIANLYPYSVWTIEEAIPIQNEIWGRLAFQNAYIPLYYNGVYYTSWRP